MECKRPSGNLAQGRIAKYDQKISESRESYYPGDRTFDPWTITVYCDEDFKVRDAFEKWMSKLNEHQANIRDQLAATPPGYTTDITVQQFSKLDLPPVKAYKLKGAFPLELGVMELDWGTMNTVHKFTVNLRYQWWDAVGILGATTDGDAGPLNG